MVHSTSDVGSGMPHVSRYCTFLRRATQLSTPTVLSPGTHSDTTCDPTDWRSHTVCGIAGVHAHAYADTERKSRQYRTRAGG